ncbi:phage tail tube protein [Phenylobacterium sp.]|uniref:phage tail tube protein n=1 Tax=Phenylobacterium sp. TaxID=1871053 RepID=UPI00301BF926
MSASEVEVAYECTLEVETAAGSGIYFELAEIKTMMKPNPQVEKHDVTHMKSPNRAREKRSGLKEYGTVTYGLNWIPDSPTDDFIEDWIDSGESRSTRLTFNPGGATRTFLSSPEGYPAEAEVGQPYEATLDLSVDGAVARS